MFKTFEYKLKNESFLRIVVDFIFAKVVISTNLPRPLQANKTMAKISSKCMPVLVPD